MKNKKDFQKWIAFSFPYIVFLLCDIIDELCFYLFSFHLENDIMTNISLLLNSTAILFGIKVLSSFTHTDNCKNYLPKNYTH